MHLEVIKSKQKKVFKELKKFPRFYLAGGTALALQIGHRVSVDFDMFWKKEIPKHLLPKVRQVFKEYKVKVLKSYSDNLTVSIDGIQLTFVTYPFPLLFKLVNFEGVNLLSVREIGLTKAYTVGRRASLKDYVDLYFIIKERYLTIEEIIRLSKKKYREEFNARLFLEQLVYLEDVKNVHIEFLKEKITKEKIQRFFEKEVRKIKL